MGERYCGQYHLVKAETFDGERDFILNYRLAGEEIQSGLLLLEDEDENFFYFFHQLRGFGGQVIKHRQLFISTKRSGSTS